MGKENLLKLKEALEKRLHNFEIRNENLLGNYTGEIRNLKRRIKEIEDKINRG